MYQIKFRGQNLQAEAVFSENLDIQYFYNYQSEEYFIGS